MFTISSNGIITLNRGDSCSFPVDMKMGSVLNYEQYVMSSKDTIYFGIMEPNQPFENAIVRKKYTHEDQTTDGRLFVNLYPQDTCCLLPGKYYYQIKLETKMKGHPSDVETIVDKTLFYIKE